MIVTQRLRLEALDRSTAEAIVAGERGGRAWHPDFPRLDDRGAARGFLGHGDETFGCLLIVDAATGLAVGTIGFFGPPDNGGLVMIGYGLVEPARGAGYATEAVRAVIAYAFAHDGVRTIAAETLLGNTASQRVLAKSGFALNETADGTCYFSLDR